MRRIVRPRRSMRPRPAAPGRPRAKRSALHALLALVVLLVQATSLLHLFLVHHVTCEHGELVDAAKPASDAPRISASEPRSARPQVDVGRGNGFQHEHCDALALRHYVPEAGIHVAPATLLPFALIEAGGEGAEARPVPLLSLAPKSSPPV